MDLFTCAFFPFFLAISQAVAVAAKGKSKSSKSKSKSKISIGVIIAIVVAVVILLIIGAVAFFIFKRLRMRKSSFPVKTQGIPMGGGGPSADPEQVSFLNPNTPAPPPAQPMAPYDPAGWRPDAPQQQYANPQSFPAPYPPTHP